jgi:quinol monooxygenase YgiN
MWATPTGKEEQMPSMFIKHRVADYAKWKPLFDEHEPARREAGAIAHSLHRDADDPNVVILTFTVKDLSRAKEFAASENMRSTMERAGVEGRPEIWFAEDLEDKRY